MNPIRKTALGATSLALALALTGCTGDEDDKGSAKAEGSAAASKPAEDRAQGSPALQAMTAANQRVAEFQSAKVKMTMKSPEELGGNVDLSGVMQWNPTAMDVTMSGAPESGMPQETRLVWLDNVMYIDAGEEMAAEMDGKQWVKLDFAALAEESGNEQLASAMTRGMQDQQNPAQQLAMLLNSPNIEHRGEETIDGQKTQHYSGTLTVEEALEANEALSEAFTEEEREQLWANVEKTGVENYEIAVWVNEDDLPVRMDMKTTTPQGVVEVTQHLSDFGDGADITAPPAGETADFFQELKEAAEEEGAA
ncbi:hypothetical protein JJV70_10460 [Streptomyces sp. JJ66]|uniref:hypothetical protein n=1 Tax=Streptomyces sp. JJ66 TaxID=2803843 RepID=UPI001C5974B7|nr:hypothetical protein [Streptomyces sp. JJ66]MBW1602524.1 hypothetical protein [Streptomyces sp. JJ66]